MAVGSTGVESRLSALVGVETGAVLLYSRFELLEYGLTRMS